MPESISKNWNTDLNYWELHPIMKTITVFKDLYNKDKSKNRNNSSKIMWAIAMLVDPHEENPWRNTSEEETKELVKEDFLQDEKFDWEHPSIKELVKDYERRCISVAERELVRLEKKMEERGDFIETTPYSLDSFTPDGKVVKGTADSLDKMLSNTKKIYDQLSDIKKEIEKDKAEGHLRGGAIKSASEEKLL
jgi:hypothetical protein